MTAKYRDFTPAYPFVIVEEIAPEQATLSGILLTDKPLNALRQGIVLKTWAPWEKSITLDLHDAQQVEVAAKWLTPEDAPGLAWTIATAARQLLKLRSATTTMRSEFVAGDHVFYTHHGRYVDPEESGVQFIREAGPTESGTILGVIRQPAGDAINVY
jgi:hypothetical protein